MFDVSHLPHFSLLLVVVLFSTAVEHETSLAHRPCLPLGSRYTSPISKREVSVCACNNVEALCDLQLQAVESQPCRDTTVQTAS